MNARVDSSCSAQLDVNRIVPCGVPTRTSTPAGSARFNRVLKWSSIEDGRVVTINVHSPADRFERISTMRPQSGMLYGAS